MIQVVVDKNVFQSWQKNYVPEKNYLVFPNVFFVEVLDDPVYDLVPKMAEMIRHSSKRILVGATPGVFSQLEAGPEKLAPPGSHIHKEATDTLRRCSKKSHLEVVDEIKMLARMTNSVPSYRKSAGEFEPVCKELVNRLAAELPDVLDKLRRHGPEHPDFMEYIQSPSLPVGFYDGTGDGSFQTWEVALTHFPDRKAFGRWCRMGAYLGMLYASGSIKKPDNHIADMQYALIASYTGYIATQDKALGKMVSILFPDVKVQPTVESFLE